MFDLSDRGNKPITDFSVGPVLVLAPHMDDEIIGPGGTVALHAQAGVSISVLFLTDGALGNPDIGQGNPTPEEVKRRRRALSETRKEESRCAAQIVGASELEFCDAPDGALDATPELVEKLATTLNQRRPKLIYAPALTDFHQDHWAANRILRSALDRMPQTLLRNVIIRGYEIWSTLPANRTADITSVITLKERAIASFASQMKSTDFASAALGLNRYRSMLHSQGRGFAEAFLETTVAEYRELFEAILLRGNSSKQIKRNP
jgi:LmbE family N-acetylglucosaminyl deacetylase